MTLKKITSLFHFPHTKSPSFYIYSHSHSSFSSLIAINGYATHWTDHSSIKSKQDKYVGPKNCTTREFVLKRTNLTLKSYKFHKGMR